MTPAEPMQRSMPDRGAVRRINLAQPIASFMLLFLVLFPKGGIKLGDIPLTWGYMAILGALPMLVMIRALVLPLRFQGENVAAIVSVLPFTLLFFYSFAVNGVSSAGYAFSTFVGLCVLPWIFLVLYPPLLKRLDGERLARQFRFCVFAAAIYGIFLFIWHPLTGHFIEIPYLTVNADDVGLLESTKHIDRGFFLKLISTYNNGNVYGVATLIILPLYELLEHKLWRRNVLKLALVLTLSRTVWAGLVAVQLLSLVPLGLQAARTFPRIPLQTAIRRAVLVGLTLLVILAGLTLSSNGLGFLFDRELGGRAGELAAFSNPTFLPSHPLEAFAEIIYGSALSEYGILGFFSVILIFGMPIFLYLAKPTLIQSPVKRAALKGIILYMVLACSDGALNLIPTMVFYWFTYMVFLEGWPGGLKLGTPSGQAEKTSHRFKLKSVRFSDPSRVEGAV